MNAGCLLKSLGVTFQLDSDQSDQISEERSKVILSFKKDGNRI